MKIDQKVLLNIDSKSQQDVFALIAEEAVLNKVMEIIKKIY